MRVCRAWLLAFAIAGCAGDPLPSAPANVPAPSASTESPAAGGRTTSDVQDAGSDVETLAAPFVSATPVDVLVRGGMVVDGSGRPPFRADVVVDGGRIVHVGAVDPALQADTTIDASGRFVAPGFIDAHSHAQPTDGNENLVAMGVTTACIGQDGQSPTRLRLSAWAKSVEAKGLVVNVAPLVGHGTVRATAGVGVRAPSPAELDRMRRIVDEAMEDGAFGMSTGLEYAPGRFAKMDELVALAEPVARRGGIVMSHLRSEDDAEVDAALDELLEQGRRAKVRVHVAHFKVVEGHGKERAERLLARIEAARSAGTHVTADIYPYTASYTGVDILFPDWAKPSVSLDAALAKRRDELRAWLRRRVTQRNGPEAMVFGTAPFAGKTLGAVSRELAKPFEDVLIEDAAPAGLSAAYFVMDEELQSRLLVAPYVMIGTDGGGGSAHPRAYGTFARVLAEHVTRRGTLSLEEAVRKMTSLPAETLGLDDRGLLRPGRIADLVVFDPARVRDLATYEKPHRLSEGFDSVLVNGAFVLQAGRFTSARPGRVLRHRPR